MKTKSLLLCCLIVALAPRAEAQGVYIWNTAVTNGLWNNAANWEDGIVPNEVNALVFFENTASTSVDLSGFTATVGDMVFDRNVTLGSTGVSDDILNLESTLGQPILSVADGGNVFMYAEVTGTNGFRKEGLGRLTFRFNPNDQTYRGDITLAGGMLGINQDGSLGDPENDILVEANSTLQIEPGNNTNAVTLGAGRNISIDSGANLSVNNGGSAVVTTIEGAISGDGNLTFGGTGSLILSGVNTYTGTMQVNGPGYGTPFTFSTNTNTTPPTVTTNTNTVVRTSLVSFAAENALRDQAPLAVSFGSAAATNNITTIAVNLGGFDRTFSTFSILNNTNNASINSLMALDISNGGMTYANPSGAFNFSARGSGNVTNELRLPDRAELSYASFTLGAVSAPVNAQLTSRVLIGSNAVLNADQISFGAWRASGLIEPRAAGASLKIRGTDGVSPVTNMLIGNFAGGPSPVATINMSNGSVDIAATSIDVARNVAGSSGATGSLQFGGGTVTADTLVVSIGAHLGNANVAITNTNIVTGFVTQNGGSATFSNIMMGRTLASDPSRGPVVDRYTSTYNLNGGTLATALINTENATNVVAVSGMTRTFNLNGGTLRGLDASSDLTITATTNAFSAIGFVAGTTNSKTIAVDTGRSINFSAGVAAQFNGGTTTFELAADSVANLEGRFQIGVGTTNPASVVVTNGTVNLSSASGIFGIGDRTAGSSALNISGGNVNIALVGANRMLVGNKFDGSVNVTGGALTITGSPDIYVGGDISFAAANALGTMTVANGGLIDIQSAGNFILGQNQTNGATTGAIGRLNINQGGTFRTVRPVRAGTNGVSTGEVNFDGGTLAAGASVPSILAVTAANITTNGFTFDTGTFDSGIGQNLGGTGTLTVIGTGTLRLNGTNTPPVAVNAGATLGGTGTAGNVTVNGTLAPGAPDGDGAFTVTGSLSVPGTARFRVYGNGINDRLLTSGGAALGGTVVVVLDGDYAPASGDTFDLVDGTITGTPTLDLPALQGGLIWVTNSFTSAGVLSITNGGEPTGNYAAWVSYWQAASGGAFTDTNGSADPDGDGFDNNMEFAFDGNPTVSTRSLMTVSASGTDAVFNWVERKNPPGGVTYQVQRSSSLTNGWTAATGLNISNSLDQTGILIPADYERKEFIVPASGKDFYRVQATINE